MDPKAVLDKILKFKRVFTIEEAVKDVDIVAIMTPWEEFKKITPKLLKKYNCGNLILDPYNLLDETSFINAGFNYFTLGKNQDMTNNKNIRNTINRVVILGSGGFIALK